MTRSRRDETKRVAEQFGAQPRALQFTHLLPEKAEKVQTENDASWYSQPKQNNGFTHNRHSF